MRMALLALVAHPCFAEPDEAALHRANEIARQYWHGEPFDAARGLAVQIWGYLVDLGDEAATNRLYNIANSNGDKALSAARALYWAGDERVVDAWLRLAANRKLMLSQRGLALAMTGPYFPKDFDTVPPELEALSLEILDDANSPYSLQLLAAETLSSGSISPECFDTLQRIVKREFATAIRLGNTNSASRPACIADAAVIAAARSGSPSSRALFVDAIETSPWSSVRCSAAKALARSEGNERAVALLLEQFDPVAPNVVDRVADASTLLRLGHEPARRTIVNAMYHPDDEVRAQAYAALCSLGDDVFLDVALTDYDPYDQHNGFAWLGGQGFAKKEPSRGLQARYMLGVATSARRTDERWGALAMLAEERLLTEEVRALALPALEEPIPALAANADYETIVSWQVFCAKHAVLLRVGAEAERTKALERLIETYHCAEERHFEIVRFVGRSQYPPAKPFLREQMHAEFDEDTELVQMFAAIGYLAIETDRIPY